MTVTEASAEQEWLERYAWLVLRVTRRAGEGPGGGVPLDYRGPAAWREQVAAETPPPPGRLVEEADALRDALRDDQPFPAERAAFLAAHVDALRTIARRLDGEELPLVEYARRCLGIEATRVPEPVLEAAHDRLDAALPRKPATAEATGAGVAKGTRTLADRLHAWQDAHLLPPTEMDRLPGLVARAVAETRARTHRIVPLPEDEEVDCQLVTGVAFHGAGAHHGGGRSTLLVNRDVPFNLADLLYLVSHEGHPGHIAESVLKERHLAGGSGLHEHQVRFLLSPQFVISEGLGCAAQELIFPGDEAQAWLTDNVLAELGIPPDGSDFAAIHEARNVLFGAWGNAVLMLGEGRPDDEVREHLSRWALLRDSEIARFGPDLDHLKVPYGEPYILCYHQGWRIVRSLLARDAPGQARRLLTEEVLPADP